MPNPIPNPSPEKHAEEFIFRRAIALSGQTRSLFLDQACGPDQALRSRLDGLLQAHESANLPLDREPQSKPGTIHLKFPDPPVEEGLGLIIDRYKLLERIGEGGCGVVYVAEQTEPVRRRVALKVIKPGMDTKQVIARFEAERQALAMMDHPHIAKILDAGTTDSGRPFFVMELVRGIPITEYCDQAKLETRERLELFIKICQAIQHAHQKGIIHRDIKPSNILVTLHDGVPVPKVIDFGIAKATESRLTDKTVYTQLHQFIGTPAYMSPEQAEMSGLDIDTRSDIYSLGVLLYELLVGCPPFDPKELIASGIDAMRRTIREKNPARPSLRLMTMKADLITTTAQRRSVDRNKLISQLKGDLDWIAIKCLEKDRTRRYETANGLAADVQRHLTNEPVAARAPSTAYRFQKAFQRNKFFFVTGGVTAAALVMGIGLSLWQAIRATHAERLQSQLRQQAEEAKTKESESRRKAESAQANEAEQRQKAEAARDLAERFRKRTYLSNIQLADDAMNSDRDHGIRLRDLLDKHLPGVGEPDLRGFEWWHLDFQIDSFITNRNQLKGFEPLCAAFNASNGNIYLGCSNGTIALVDGVNLGVLQTWVAHTEPIRTITLSPDKTQLATSAGMVSRIWNLRTGILTAELSLPATKLAFVSEDTIAALIREATVQDSTPGRLEIWNVHHRQMVQLLASNGVDFDVVQSKATNVIAILLEGNRLTVSSLPDLRQISSTKIPIDWRRIAFSPTAEAVAGLDKENRLAAIRLRDDFLTPAVNSMEGRQQLTNRFTCFAWWPEGDVLIGGSEDFSIQSFLYGPSEILSRSRPSPRDSPKIADFFRFDYSGSHGSPLVGLDGKPGGAVTAVSRNGLLVRQRRYGSEHIIPGFTLPKISFHYPESGRVIFDSRGKLAAIYQNNNGLVVFDIDERREVIRMTNGWQHVVLLGFSKDNSAVRLVSYQSSESEKIQGQLTTLETWDIKSGLQRTKVTLENAIWQAPYGPHLSPDGRWLVGPYWGPHPGKNGFSWHGLAIWDATTGAFQHLLDLWVGNALAHQIESCECSPCEPLVAVGLQNGGIKLWQLDTGRAFDLVPDDKTGEGRDRLMWFASDGQSLFVHKMQMFADRYTDDLEVDKIDFITRRSVAQFKLRDKDIRCDFRGCRIVCSPDGKTLAVYCNGRVHLFPADGGEKYFSLAMDKDWFLDRGESVRAFFAPDGRTLAATSLDGRVHFWFARRDESR